MRSRNVQENIVYVYLYVIIMFHKSHQHRTASNSAIGKCMCNKNKTLLVYSLFEQNICKRNRGGDVQGCLLCICPMYIICTLPEQIVPNLTWKNIFFADLQCAL